MVPERFEVLQIDFFLSGEEGKEKGGLHSCNGSGGVSCIP